MPFIQELYHSDFKTKLLLAHQLYKEKGEMLCSLPMVIEGLAALELKAQILKEKMTILGFAPFCTSCAKKSGGGCCSLYMADENDAVLFLINLLAGYQVSIQRDDNFECYLLGPEGCMLRFKPMFCLNYNCHAVKTGTKFDILSSYLKASAQLLQEQWQLETIIIAYLRTTIKQFK